MNGIHLLPLLIVSLILLIAQLEQNIKLCFEPDEDDDDEAEPEPKATRTYHRQPSRHEPNHHSPDIRHRAEDL
jgi:hypothetical protein